MMEKDMEENSQNREKTAETEAAQDDGKDFAERYQLAKQKEIQALAAEIENKNSRDTAKKKRNWWIKTVLLLLLIGVSIAIMFTMNNFIGGETKSFASMIAGVNWTWFAILIAVLVLSMLIGSAMYSYLLRISTGKFRYKNSVKTLFLGKYYDGITPFGTGGQPFQIYYLHKRNVPAGVATAVPLVKFIVGTIVFCLTAIALFITANAVMGNDLDLPTYIIAWVSMGFNFFVPVAIVFVSLFPNLGKKMIVGIVKLLNKLHIVKRPLSVMKKYVYEIEEYRASLKVLITHWGKLIPIVLLSAVDTLLYTFIPFCVVIAIANVQPTTDYLIHIMCMSMISFYASSLIPTPGNSVANEALTALIFLKGFSNESLMTPVIGWVILVWRFATYYVYILTGIGINIFEIIRSAYRAHRAKRLGQE